MLRLVRERWYRQELVQKCLLNVTDEELVQSSSLYTQFLNEEDLATNENAKMLNDLILSKIAIAMER